MQNLSDDERRDIDDLVNNLKPEGIEEKPAEEKVSHDGSNGEGFPETAEDTTISEEDNHEALTTDSSSIELLKLVSLQNEKLGILNKKVDILTRLVELILRANLEEVD